MSTRSAEATIKGYYYQFDASILELLKLTSDSDSIVVEGIEDIDINTATDKTAIQCKYLSKPKFSNSAAREPIILMLDNFLDPNSSKDLKYVLYAHFEQGAIGNEPTIDVEKLKEILTFKEDKVERQYHVEKKISDEALNNFLTNFSFKYGLEFSKQQEQVVLLLKKQFNCSEIEADMHFYNNSLRVILDLAIKKDPSDRKITKRDFIKAVDSREKLFTEWFVKLRGKKKYIQNATQILKTTKATEASKSKMLVLGNDIISETNSEMPIADFIENIATKYYKVNSSLYTAKPVTFVIDCEPERIRKIKSVLISNGIPYNDGFEEINFSTDFFDTQPIVNTVKGGTKITKASYWLRIISKKTLEDNITKIKPPKVMIKVSNQTLVNLSFPGIQILDFFHFENLTDVSLLF